MRISLVPAVLLSAAIFAGAQEDSVPQKRLRTPAAAEGVVGGEAHDSYVIHADEGQTLSVEISWERSAGNRAEFMVSESPSFMNAEPVTFGSGSDGGRHWSGRIPRARDYRVYVVAHPTAHYTLRVAVKGDAR
jgi:hypothetical protein